MSALVTANLPVQARLLENRRESSDTNTLTLESPPVVTGGKFFFAPGQFNMLGVPGLGEVPISISGDPAQPQKLVHTVRAVGNVTEAITASHPGACLTVRGPFGVGWPVEKAAGEGREVILVAGGVGLPPLRPAIYHFLANPALYPTVTLLYGARDPLDLVFKRELEQWTKRSWMRVEITVDRAGSTGWLGRVGVVTTLIGQVKFNPARVMAMICGPEIMLRYTILELQKRGVAPENIYISMERNMKCGTRFCGHCQWGPYFICKDGPVFSYDQIKDWFSLREI
jgi:NAD(P)H-flavin reductase